MINSLTRLIGLRYAGARQRNQLVSFISAISILGLVLAVALLVVVLSVMNGFDRELRERILGVLPQASLYHRDGIEDWQSLQQQLLANPQIQAVSPFVELQGLLSVKQEVAPVAIYGVAAEEEAKTSSIGDYISPEEFRLLAQGDALLLGRGLADKLGLQVGDKLLLIVPSGGGARQAPKLQSLRVAAIFNTGTEVDNSLALMDLMAASTLSGQPGRVTALRLQLDDLFAAPQVVRQIVHSLAYGYYSSDWTRTHGNLFQAIQMSKKLVGLLLVLIIAISAFNVVSTLIMVVVDKQGDIAILRSLGASTGEIMGIFMVQGSLIGVVGTALGLLFGLLSSLLVTDLVQGLERLLDLQFLKSDVYPISYLPVDVRWQDVVLVGAVALLMAFLATIYPAWRASRVQPAEALRYE